MTSLPKRASPDDALVAGRTMQAEQPPAHSTAQKKRALSGTDSKFLGSSRSYLRLDEIEVNLALHNKVPS